MAATPDMVSDHSPYVVSDAGAFTNAMFSRYARIGKELLDGYSDLNIPPATYDYLHTLLICHLKKVDEGKLELKSENVGGSDHAYEKKVGETTYLIEFRQTVEMLRELAGHSADALASTGGERSDAWMKVMAIDRSTKTPGPTGWRI